MFLFDDAKYTFFLAEMHSSLNSVLLRAHPCHFGFRTCIFCSVS